MTNKISINNNLTADVVIDGRQAKITQIKTDKNGNIRAFLVPEEDEEDEEDTVLGISICRMISTWDEHYDLCYEAAKKAGMIKIG